jgi:hypothetical protein
VKTYTLVATCLVLGSSSAAMADSFTFQARATADYRFHPVAVRDHRNAYVDVRDHRFAYGDTRVAPPRIIEPQRTIVALPPLTGPTWDCHNWDPSVETSSVCAAYTGGRLAPAPEYFGAGTLLGVRSAAIPDHQYITLDGQSFRKIVIEGNECAPKISRVLVKFMDGSTEVVNTYARLADGRGLVINLGGYRPINQIGFYTPNGATGSYAVIGR